MAKADIRFYAELNDFLPYHRRQVNFDIQFVERTSIKHIIESMGIPHTEIDLILVNGISVDFACLPQDGDKISVFPVFETLDISPLIQLRPKALRKTKFILDTHLGKLAVYLRMFGLDTSYRNDYHDDQLAILSRQEQRILLTRDRGLLKRNLITHGYYVRATIPRQQLLEVIERFDLKKSLEPFIRCLRCNHLLSEVEKQEVEHRLPPDTSQYYQEFQICPACERVFWKGSHFQRMTHFVKSIQNELHPEKEVNP